MTHQSIPEEALEIAGVAYLKPFLTKSDYARQHATMVALAASLGLITCLYPGGAAYGNTWRTTRRGLRLLETYGLPEERP